MKISIAAYAPALDSIRHRIEVNALEVDWITFSNDGKYRLGETSANPEDVSIDYLWLSPLLSTDKLVPMAFDMALRTRSIKVLQTFNAGLDNAFYKMIAAKGTTICNSSAQGIAIAEFVFAHVLYQFQPIRLQAQQQAQRLWKHTPFRELSQSTWLIIGFGPIGQAIAQRAKAFGAKTLVIRRNATLANEHVDICENPSMLPVLLPKADIIVLACALNSSTKHLANKTFFSKTRPDALLINVARGGVVDDGALLQALDEGRLGHAVLDVFLTEPLPREDAYWSHPKVTVTPHTSFAGSGTMERWNQLFLDNLARFVRNEPLLNLVEPSQFLEGKTI